MPWQKSPKEAEAYCGSHLQGTADHGKNHSHNQNGEAESTLCLGTPSPLGSVGIPGRRW